MEEFVCRTCGDIKPREGFFKDTRNKKMGIRTDACKECHSALRKKVRGVIEPLTLDSKTAKVLNVWLSGRKRT